MYKAFPCSDYYGNSVAILDIQEPTPIALRRSNLGNPHLAHAVTIWHDRLSDATYILFPLTAAASWLVLAASHSTIMRQYHDMTEQ
jgi:hypothetical protein